MVIESKRVVLTRLGTFGVPAMIQDSEEFLILLSPNCCCTCFRSGAPV
jgi:hypothetical protein